jgi:hypothetical protein
MEQELPKFEFTEEFKQILNSPIDQLPALNNAYLGRNRVVEIERLRNDTSLSIPIAPKFGPKTESDDEMERLLDLEFDPESKNIVTPEYLSSNKVAKRAKSVTIPHTCIVVIVNPIVRPSPNAPGAVEILFILSAHTLNYESRDFLNIS